MTNTNPDPDGALLEARSLPKFTTTPQTAHQMGINQGYALTLVAKYPDTLQVTGGGPLHNHADALFSRK